MLVPIIKCTLVLSVYTVVLCIINIGGSHDSAVQILTFIIASMHFDGNAFAQQL